MKVLVCGAGQVGWQIARHLARLDNDVTVVDRDPVLVRRAIETLDVRGVTGHAAHPDVLERAGAEDCDMVIAATHADEVNMVTCQVAHSLFGVPRKIARLRDQAYLDAKKRGLYRREHLPIDVVISPEQEVAEAALQRLDAPTAFDTEQFLDGRAQLVGIALDENCPVLDTSLRQLTELFSTLRAVVVAVKRGERLFIPRADDQLFAGDRIYVITAAEDVRRILEIFGRPAPVIRRVVVVGGGNVGFRVARALEQRETMRVRLIERDRQVAEEVADRLERALVLNGDGLDAEILEEAGVERAQALLALTDDDKTNLLASVRGKEAGVGFAIALLNDPALNSLVDPLGIDAWVNPRSTTVSSILRHLRHGKVRAIYAIGDGEAEIIEAEIVPTSGLAGATIGAISWPEGARIGGLLKGGVFHRPAPGLRIEVGDVVLVFAFSDAVKDVERLLEVSVSYF